MKLNIDLTRAGAVEATRIGLRIASLALPILGRRIARASPWVGVALAVVEVAAEMLNRGPSRLVADARFEAQRARPPDAASATRQSDASPSREEDLLRRWAGEN